MKQPETKNLYNKSRLQDKQRNQQVSVVGKRHKNNANEQGQEFFTAILGNHGSDTRKECSMRSDLYRSMSPFRIKLNHPKRVSNQQVYIQNVALDQELGCVLLMTLRRIFAKHSKIKCKPDTEAEAASFISQMTDFVKENYCLICEPTCKSRSNLFF
jgi:hypothetical protein